MGDKLLLKLNIKTVALSFDALKDSYQQPLDYILASQNFAINQNCSYPVIRIPSCIDQLFKLVADINQKNPITTSVGDPNGLDFSEAKKLKVGFSDQGKLLEWVVKKYSQVRNNPNTKAPELYFSAKIGGYEIELLPAGSPQQLSKIDAFLVGPGDNSTTTSGGIKILKVENAKDLDSKLKQAIPSSGKGLTPTAQRPLRLGLKPHDALWEQVHPYGAVVQTKDNDLAIKYRTRMANQDVEYVYDTEPHDYLLSSNTEGKNFIEEAKKIFNTGLGVFRATLAAVDAFRGTFNKSKESDVQKNFDNSALFFDYDNGGDRGEIGDREEYMYRSAIKSTGLNDFNGSNGKRLFVENSEDGNSGVKKIKTDSNGYL